ncbi:anti-sigma factor family protein [Actinomadura atramentaria]|uniref:anti-sigma factor family protein n=1 Tax=Actinomadura atramentaria TaxID=1990 RepID=UPI00037A33B8|nr:zf-HC2 domain-containing protein [Actinomadura atramentaria]
MNPAHLDYDTLADLAEGLLDDERAASVDEHLAVCAECRDRSADLADVPRLLADAPVPAMPDDLAARIDAALAAESRARRPGTGDGADPPGATVVDLDRRRRGRHPWRIMSAAAAAIVVLGGGGLVGRAMSGGSGDGGHLAASVPPRPVSDPDHVGAAAAPGWRVVRSGTAYRSATLPAQVAAQLGRTPAGAAAPDGRTADCVTGVAHGRAPALVDVATYDGRPATVIALAGRSGEPADIWVVAPDCSARNPHVLTHTG